MAGKASEEFWDENTGMDIVKTSGKAIVACGALVVFAVTLGAVGPYLGAGS